MNGFATDDCAAARAVKALTKKAVVKCIAASLGVWKLGVCE